jgi:hypothetical protein
MPSWQSFSFTERSAVLSSCAPMHLLNAHLAELQKILSDSIFLKDSQQSSFLCAPLYTCSMPTWQSSTKFLRDSVFCLNSQQSSFNCTLYLYSMPSWQSFTKLLRDSICNCVFPHTTLPPEVFNNLKGLLLSCRFQSYAAAHLCLNLQCSEVHPLCTALRTCSVLSHPPGMKP